MVEIINWEEFNSFANENCSYDEYLSIMSDLEELPQKSSFHFISMCVKGKIIRFNLLDRIYEPQLIYRYEFSIKL